MYLDMKQIDDEIMDEGGTKKKKGRPSSKAS